jgi:hypothetical protein
LFGFPQSIFCANRRPFLLQKGAFTFTVFPFKQFSFSDSILMSIKNSANQYFNFELCEELLPYQLDFHVWLLGTRRN